VRRSPQCARDGVPTRLVGALNRGQNLETFASSRAVEAERRSKLKCQPAEVSSFAQTPLSPRAYVPAIAGPPGVEKT
jgi:hypothetical protein